MNTRANITIQKGNMSQKAYSSITIESLEKTQGKERSVVHSFKTIWGKSLWGGIKQLRPLFNVENHTLPHRLLISLVPPFFSGYRKVYTDLKGPMLVLITLMAILLYGLMTPGRTLLTALFVATKLTLCYWLVLTAVISALGFACDTKLTPLQLLSIIGYSLSGHCIVLLISELLHQENSHTVFFVLTTVFGGLATGRLAIVTLTCTPGPPQRLILGSVLASVHLMHLVYIHYACMRKKFAV